MTRTEAIRIIALDVIATAVNDAPEYWESYPSIGAYDWEDVMDVVSDIVKRPVQAGEAYDVLAKASSDEEA